MLYKHNSNKSEKRSYIISKELQKCNIDIAGLREVRLAKNGSSREETGYTFCLSWDFSSDRNESGGTLAVRNDLLPSMPEDPKPVTDRLITLKFPFVDSR